MLALEYFVIDLVILLYKEQKAFVLNNLKSFALN